MVHNFDKFIFSQHSLVRAKQRISRLNNSNLELFLIVELRNILKTIQYHEFEDKSHYYFKVPNLYEYYFVVKKSNNLVLTITKISFHKKLQLIK